MTSGSAGPLDHPSGVLPPRREPHDRNLPHLSLWPGSCRVVGPDSIPIPSNGDRIEPVGPSLLRLPLLTDAPPVTTADLDALGAATEFQFGDSAAGYSHAEWAREQQTEPVCNAAMRYIALGRPERFPANFLSCLPSHQRPPFSEVQELANKGRLNTTDAGIVLLARKPSPPPCVGHATPGGPYGLFIER